MSHEKVERIESTWYQVRYVDRGGNDKPAHGIDFPDEQAAHAFVSQMRLRLPYRMVRITRHDEIVELARNSKKD